MGKQVLFIIFLFQQVIAQAASVVVTGDAAGYTGRVISVFQVEDYVSNRRQLLTSAEIADNGAFNLTFDIQSTSAVIISIQRIESVMYVQPGKKYAITFPPVLQGTVRKYDRTSVDLAFRDLPDNDINLLIRSFNAMYAAFVSEHYYDFAAGEYHGSDAYLKSLGENANKTDLMKRAYDKDSTRVVQPTTSFPKIVQDFSAQVNKDYEAHYGDTFFRDYVKYSLAELDLMSGRNRTEFYHEYFMSQPVQPSHPSYMSCFHAYYHDFLSGRKKEIQSAIVKAVNQERNPMKLVNLFEGDSTCLGEEVRWLAVIKGLNDIYYDKTYTRHSIEKTLSNFPSKNNGLRQIAINTHDNLRNCEEGSTLHDFTLPDERGDKWKLSEHAGSPVYILFFATWSSSAMKELQIMRNLDEKYGKVVLFVAISMDDDYAAFTKYLTEHKEQKFTFLYGGGDPNLSYHCKVRSIPHAIMLDQDGKVMYSNTRKPSEGIQMDLDKLMQVMKQNNQGPKTWRD